MLSDLLGPSRYAGEFQAGSHRWANVKIIGKYRILAVLGEGGQAITFQAWDPDLQREVVLKLYHAAQSPAQQEAILKEGQALARVHSPYVTQCYGVERHEGVPYLVMEYIAGQSLAERQREQPLDTDQALELLRRVARGLAAVHAAGLLHRDLKPANILVGDDGIPRLADFGLAKPLGDAGLKRISGTLAYMPPEQARGEANRIDARTDLFGLGGVLYHLLTGSPPYQAETMDELLQAARQGQVVPTRERNHTLDSAVSRLCMRCLAQEPVERYHSATDLERAIRRLQHRRRWLPRLRNTTIVLAAMAACIFLNPLIRTFPSGEAIATDTLPPARRAVSAELPIKIDLTESSESASVGNDERTNAQLISFEVEAPPNSEVGIWYQPPVGSPRVVRLAGSTSRSEQGSKALPVHLAVQRSEAAMDSAE